MIEGRTFHLTHRCHDRRFLLRFAAARNGYREWLRVGARRYGVAVYAYCITRNHTHVVVYVHDREAVALLMALAAGAVGQALNRKKGHEGSVWEHPYQCTMVEHGPHLLNCLRYVDLNMVRAGIVKDPALWRWCGYDETCGERQRNRILDLDGLAARLGLDSVAALRALHRERVAESIRSHAVAREPHWTEGVAVGSEAFVADAQATLKGSRRIFSCSPLEVPGDAPSGYVLREASAPYESVLKPKIAF